MKKVKKSSFIMKIEESKMSVYTTKTNEQIQKRMKSVSKKKGPRLLKVKSEEIMGLIRQSECHSN